MGFLASIVFVSVLPAIADASAPANATSRATKVHKIAALQRSSLQEPRNKGHFLHKHELQPIISIGCLQEKQRNPGRPCSEEQEPGFSGRIDMGHFPNFKDGICNSNMEYFCDPANLFGNKERQAAQEHLQAFNEQMQVKCDTAQTDSHPDEWYKKADMVQYGRAAGLEGFSRFNLAVVVADEWPSTEMDAKSMEYFGNVIMAQWGLVSNYNGVDHQINVNENHKYNSNCPNAAMLVILPRYHEAFLISPSCKFICQSRGGPEVVAATLVGLDRGGLQEAVKMGIDQIQKILQVTGEGKASVTGSRTSVFMDDEKAYAWTIRVLYALVILAAVFFTTAFVYYVLLDKARLTRTSHGVMNDTHSRHTLQRAFMQG